MGRFFEISEASYAKIQKQVHGHEFELELKKRIEIEKQANGKLDDLTVKKLTRGNATMTEMFEKLENNQ